MFLVLTGQFCMTRAVGGFDAGRVSCRMEFAACSVTRSVMELFLQTGTAMRPPEDLAHIRDAAGTAVPRRFKWARKGKGHVYIWQGHR